MQLKFYNAAPPQPIVQDTIAFGLESSRRSTHVNRTYPRAATGPIPTVLFIHGRNASRDAYPKLAQSWAQAGYLVLRPDMADSYYEKLPASETDWRGRYGDTQELTERVDELVPHHLERDRLGLAGHSFGARCVQAALGMAFADGSDFRVLDVDCGLLLSPQGADGTTLAQPFGAMLAPLLTLTGTADDADKLEGGEQPASWRTQCAREANVITALSVYDFGDHGHGFPFGPSGRVDTTQQSVELDQCLAWLDWTLKDDRKAAKWATSGMWKAYGAPIAEYSVRNWPTNPLTQERVA